MTVLLVLSAIVLIAILLAVSSNAQVGKRADAASAEREARGRALFQETQEFLARIQQSGELPSIEVPNLHVQRGEFVLLQESGVRLAACETVQVPIARTGEPGIAGLFYPGGWKTEYTMEQALLAAGALYLTNRRLLFISNRRSISLPWRALIDSCGFLDSLRVSITDSDAPFSFALKNAMLWATMIKWMTSTDINEPKLGPGARIEIGLQGGGPEYRLEVTVHTDDLPLASQ